MLRVAVPVMLARLRVWVDKGVQWTPVDHIVLWALASAPRTSQGLAQELDIPSRLISEIILNFMRVGWVELDAGALAFRATEDGRQAVRDFDSLPVVPSPAARPLSFLIEPFVLRPFPLRDLRYYTRSEIDEIAGERDVRRLVIDGEANSGLTLDRLRDAADEILAEAGRGETLSTIDTTASRISREFALFAIADGKIRGLPPGSPEELQDAIRRAAKAPADRKEIRARPARLSEEYPAQPPGIATPPVNRSDIVTAGADHRDLFLNILRNARSRVFIHSTFLRAGAFIELEGEIRQAAQRGVRMEILWGSAKSEQSVADTCGEAIEINTRCQHDLQLRNRVLAHMKSTGSHAKLLIADTGAPDRFIAVVGSCNWLSAGFNRVEMSVVLRHPGAVACVAREFAELIFAGSYSSEVAGDLNRIARELRKQPALGGEASVRIISGDTHGDLIRLARDSARRRIIVGADRLGIAAEARTLIPLIAAAGRSVAGTICYSRRSGPLSPSDVQALEREAERAGVAMAALPDRELHGKFLLWDDDNIVVSSLNWPSADTSTELPQGEIGVHVTSPGLAAAVASDLNKLWPSLRNAMPARDGAHLHKERTVRAR